MSGVMLLMILFSSGLLSWIIDMKYEMQNINVIKRHELYISFA